MCDLLPDWLLQDFLYGTSLEAGLQTTAGPESSGQADGGCNFNHISPVLGLVTVASWFTFKVLMYTYKALHCLGSHYLSEHLFPRSSMCTTFWHPSSQYLGSLWKRYSLERSFTISLHNYMPLALPLIQKITPLAICCVNFTWFVYLSNYSPWLVFFISLCWQLPKTVLCTNLTNKLWSCLLSLHLYICNYRIYSICIYLSRVWQR